MGNAIQTSYAISELEALIANLQAEKAKAIQGFDDRIAHLEVSLEMLREAAASQPTILPEDLPEGWTAETVGKARQEKNLINRLIVLARDNNNMLKARPAAVFLIAVGLSRASEDNLYTNITGCLQRSDDFERTDTGTYKLVAEFQPEVTHNP